MKDSDDFSTLRVCRCSVVFRRHVEEHVAEPVVGDGGDQVGLDAKLGAAERRRDRVAAERHRVFRGDRFLVALRHVVGEERHVDIGLADEERFA